MASKKRKNRDEDSEEYSSDSAADDTRKRPAKKQKKTSSGITMSSQEKETLISTIIRLLLFKHGARVPVRRQEILAEVRKTHRTKSGMVDELFEEAQKRMKHLFGMEAVPLPRRIPEGDQSLLFRVELDPASASNAESEITKTKKKTVRSDQWIICMTGQPSADFPGLSEAEVYTRAEQLNADSDIAPRMGLLMVIYALLVCSHERLDEADLWERLEEFGVKKGDDHPVFGRPELVLDSFTKELYLNRIKDEEATRDATERKGTRTAIYFYTFGPRLHAEMRPEYVVKFLHEVTDISIPESIKRQIEKYNVAQYDEENDASGDGEIEMMSHTQPSQTQTQPSQSQNVYEWGS